MDTENDFQGDLETHIGVIRAARPHGADRVVYRHIVIARLGKTLSISEDDFPSFHHAFNHDLVKDAQREFAVNWDTPALGEVSQAINDFTEWLSELPDGVAADLGIEPTNLGFWRRYI